MTDSEAHEFDPVMDSPLWGADEIGQVLRRTKRQVYDLIRRNHLDVDRYGHIYSSTRRRLLKPKKKPRK